MVGFLGSMSLGEIEGLHEETGNPRPEKNKAKIYSPWIGTYPKKGFGSLKSRIELK